LRGRHLPIEMFESASTQNDLVVTVVLLCMAGGGWPGV
jgi:hypothetical protein